MRIVLSAALLVATALQPGAAVACGFENPQTIALGALNAVYPDALHVRAAVWRAEESGLLPPGDLTGALGPLAFYRAVSAVKRFGTGFAAALPSGTDMAVSVVLIPQVMWTRIEIERGAMTVQTHADGPREDDLVIVTEGQVVRELVGRTLDPQAADAAGLLRYYGSVDDVAIIQAALARMFGPASLLP